MITREYPNSYIASLNVIRELKKNINVYSNIILSGGNSIKDILRILNKNLICFKLHKFYLSDERITNYCNTNKSIYNKLLTNKGYDTNFISKTFYLNQYKKYFPLNQKYKNFAILGVGRDGHIASIFLDSKILKSKNDINIIKNNWEIYKRISINFKTLLYCKKIFLLFYGTNKEEIYNICRKNNKHNQNLPVIKLINLKQNDIIMIRSYE